MKRRISEISWANVLFCFLVILIHVLSDSLATLDPTSWQYRVLFLIQKLSFVAVPGFFLLSGIKLFLNPPQKLGRYYLKRIRTILIPYMLAVAVYYGIYVYLGWYPLSFSMLAEFWFNGRVGSHFYFVVCLLQFILLTPLWIRLVDRYHPVLVLPLAAVINLISVIHLNNFMSVVAPEMGFQNSDRTFTSYLLFFLAGCYIGKDYEKAKALLQKHARFITVAFAVFAVMVCLGFGFSLKMWIPGMDEVHFAYEALGILFVLMVAAKLPALPGFVAALDRISYLIYLYHMLVVVLYGHFVALNLDMGLQLIIRAAVVYIVTIGLCLIWHQGVSVIKNLKKRRDRS